MMPTEAFSGEHGKQGQREPSLLSAFLLAYGLRCHWLWHCVLLAGIGLWSEAAQAIPPNTPVTNTATVNYSVAGVGYSAASSDTLVTDAGSGNSPPFGVQLDPSSVAENTIAASVGTLVVADSDPGDSHTFVLSDPRFVVNGSSLQLAPGQSLDFESEPSVGITVTVTDSDGATYVELVTVTVIDVNEAPSDLSLSSQTLDAGQLGAVVGNVLVVDPDVGDTHVYVVDDVRFEFVGTQLKLIDAESLVLGSVVTVLVTVTDAGGLSYAESFDITATPPGGGSGINSSIAVFQFADGVAGAQSFDVGVTQCDAGSGFVDLAAPVSIFGGVIAVPGPAEVLPTNIVKSGDVLFVQVIDPDANLDPASRERLLALLSTDSLDTETISMLETSADSGVFVGYVQTSGASVQPNSCVVEIDGPQNLSVAYTDANDVLDTAVVNVLVDPFGLVFDSASGNPINGAGVVIVDAVTGQPAQVFADDGSSPFPASVVSGDGSFGFTTGAYRFPFVNPGDYLLQIVPPNRFAFPSAVPDADLQTLSGAPYALGPGSRGQLFTLPVGPALRIDIPLDLLPVVPTTSNLELLALRPGSVNNRSEYVQVSQCFNGTDFVVAADPVSLAQGAVTVPGIQNLSVADRFARGDVVFIKLSDADQDLDPFAPDAVEVNISVPGQADLERVLLLETNDSTGQFTGYLQTSTDTAATSSNCQLEADPSSGFLVSYNDPVDATDTASRSALFDPGFTTFSSTDGALVSGATVTLLDAGSGLPAVNAVFSTDGVTGFPATLIVGSSSADSAGRVFNFAPGTFYYPVIAPGDYRLEVIAPESYEFPSIIDDPTLDALDAGPFVLVPASRGADFTVSTGVPAAFDVPLDPINAEVFVSKQASKDVAAIGDFVQYQVKIENGDNTGTITNLTLVDTLPLGFRMKPGSLQVDGVRGGIPDIAVDGRELNVALPDLLPGASAGVSYVAEITAGAKLGLARNLATVTGSGIGSANVAFADVEVKEDLFLSKATVIGQVYTDGCAQQETSGMAGVRIWLENGTFVVTDASGKFHIEGVEPGTHVVQMDLATIPDSHEPVQCSTNSRFAGSTFSQFVDVQAGTLWRADFYLAQKPDQVSEIVARLDAEAADGIVHYSFRLKGGAVPLEDFRATLMLDEQLAFIGGSARVNGKPVGDPSGIDMGAPTFELADTAATFEYMVEFDAFVKNPRGVIESKALVMFASTAGRHRSEVVVNTLSLNWPSSLIIIAESIGKPRYSSALGQPALKNQRRVARVIPASFAISTEVHEPSNGSHRVRSNVSKTQVSVASVASDTQPYQLPNLDRGAAPPFDMSWLAANQANRGIAWPPERYNPVLPAVEVAVVHSKDQKAVLLVDGKLVNPVAYEGTTTHHELGVSFSRWDNVTVSERDSLIEARVLDRDGVTVESYTRPIHFSGAPARAELVAEESYLVADGLYAPVVAVRLFDRAGYPLRPGTTGEFTVLPPYSPLDKAKHLESIDNNFNNLQYTVLLDGIAYIQLEPTTETGEVELQFKFDAVRSDNVRARLVPGVREWIMVGLLEGTYARNSLNGNMQALGKQNLEQENLTDGRASFYAKGMVTGDWLLTVAYDTDKKFERRLREQIDPNRFYTLYGDGSEQLYDAESQRKLYLKLERSRFGALFGNFDTGFERSQLARYERRMNGVNVGYFGERVEVNTFASQTNQAFVRDELLGDGTSGVYRLSNGGLVVNSEAVRIVTRDRFATENVLDEAVLSRHVDYTIDYDRGTLIFKQPVFSQDEAFNPIFIEVEYEVTDEGADEEIVAGTRIAYRLDDQDSEVALTYVNDGTQGQGGDLVAADLTWQFNSEQKITVEMAQTDTDLRGQGDAYLVELEHATEKLAGRIFFREQEQAFGLGNQSILEAGTRKYGVEGEYRWSDDVLLRAQSFQQQLLQQGSKRFVVNALSEWRYADTRLSAGVQSVREDTATGDSLDSTKLLLGAARSLMRNKLVLRTDAEIDVASGASNTDYPSRSVFGVEYEVLKNIKLIAEQELTWGDDRDTQDTRFGVRARPWTGADVNTMVSRENGENGARLFATTGLLQQWRINDRWLYDVGFDRVQTITDSGAPDTPEERLFNPGVPPASGSFDGDFTAFFTGIGYRRDSWDVSSRLEMHRGDQSDKWNFLLGANHQLADGKVMAASLSVLNEETDDGAVQDNTDFRVGLAWRPFDSSWSFLNRTDLVFESRDNEVFDTRTRKWVNNFNANFKARSAHQVALQLGLKYVVEQIDEDEYDGITALYGLEYRYDLTPTWDLGLKGSALHSFDANVVRYSYGASIGHTVMNNMWLSVGYNVAGFDDEDFFAAEYTAKGPYIKIRMKFDQDLAKRFLEFAGVRGIRDDRSYADRR